MKTLTLEDKARRHLRKHLRRMAHFYIVQGDGKVAKSEVLYEDKPDRSKTAVVFGIFVTFTDGSSNIYEVAVYGEGRSYKVWQA